MRRILLGLIALTTFAAPLAVGAAPVQSAPPGPQCVIAPCDEGPVGTVEYYIEKIVRTCQHAYCQPLP